MSSSALSQPLLASSAAATHFLDRVAEELGIIDRTSQIRVKFPGEWRDPSSDPGTVGKWYRLQGECTRFQTAQYRKFKKFVQHECIVFPLFNDLGQSAKWFCLVERTPDPRFKDRIHAISASGTDAHDLIQVFHRTSNEYRTVEQDSIIVASIDYPQTLDLYHVLIICWAIGMSPKAQRYTLPQFNCYFFSWTIILCLARYAAGWEIAYHSCARDIKEEILKSVKNSDSTTQAKLILILSKIRGSSIEESQNQLPLLETLRAELGSEGFSSALGRSIRSMLWEENGPSFVRTALRGRLKVLADKTVDLLVGGMGLDDELPLLDQKRGSGSRSIHRYSLEAAKIFHRDAWNQAPGHVKELQRRMSNQSRSIEDAGAPKSLARRIGASRGVILALMPVFVAQYGYQGAYLAA
ncbi:unnamed protein product [Rhizoctonia solani]|uniref:Uncharacterized protein n=1 Tax=Rhizoctonia solani TaxID=456999 RepID=A0A8H3A6C2_9AGAM|nr:unnamed protein product [Rhizoctonia solani]